MDHAALEADRHEPVFYNALSFQHPRCHISSTAPYKEYIEKFYKIATGVFKQFLITQKV